VGGAQRIAGRGGEASFPAQMLAAAERLYRTFVTRVVRDPASLRSVDKLPVMIGAVDLPVRRRAGTAISVADATINGGMHLHAVLLVPPRSRLRVDAAEHFRAGSEFYVPAGSVLRRLDVRGVDHGDVARVADYVLKTIRSGRVPYDRGVLILPRAFSELR
jgi:hypothetical protein